MRDPRLWRAAGFMPAAHTAGSNPPARWREVRPSPFLLEETLMWRALLNRRAGRRPASRKPAWQTNALPQVEALDRRALPSVTTGFAGGVLTVTGDGANDSASL